MGGYRQKVFAAEGGLAIGDDGAGRSKGSTEIPVIHFYWTVALVAATVQGRDNLPESTQFFERCAAGCGC